MHFKKAIKLDGSNISFLLVHVKEAIIFSGVTIILYCNYHLTNMLTFMIYYRYNANNKIESDINTQIQMVSKYNSLNRTTRVRGFTLSAESLLLENDLKYNGYSLLSYLILTPIIFGLLYFLFIQLNLRSRYRYSSTFLSFLLVILLFFYNEFNTLLLEGEGLIFIVNCIVPFITSFFLCLFVLLTPKNGRFSYYN
jgi:hypothetical protein